MTTLRDILVDMVQEVITSQEEADKNAEVLTPAAVETIVDGTIDDIVKRLVGKGGDK